MRLNHLFNNMLVLVLTASVIALTSCSQNDDDDSDRDEQVQEQQTDQGSFETTNIVNVNQTVVTNVNMVNNIVVQGDDVDIDINVNNVPRNVRHRQHIHRGNRCPTQADDTNGDGFVDEVESFNVTGEVLVPLDTNIESQESGAQNFPTAGATGRYRYRESGSLTRILADLRAPDSNPADEFGKLDPAEEFNLSGRVLIVYGISRSVSLPASFMTLQGGNPHDHFPVACSVIQRQSGGATTGTTTTGGVTTGGVTTGGVTTGGVTTGGVTTGGVTTGTATTGGASTGATTTGGAATGSTTTGGATTGTTTGSTTMTSGSTGV